MERIFAKMILCIVLASVVVLLLNNPARSAQPITLLFAAAEHETGPYCKAMIEYANELKEKSNGRVDVKFAFGGSLGKMGEFYDLLTRGLCDVALCLPTLGNPGSFPMAEIIGLPWNLPNAETTTRVLQQYTKKGYVSKEFNKVKILTTSGGHGEPLFTRKKPVISLEDFKGLKIHASTPAIQQKVKLMGGVPLQVNLPDLYSALQKGVIDGLLGNWAFQVMFKLSEVTQYVTGPGTGGVVFILTAMNKDTWNKLPSDIQTIVDGLSDKYSRKYAANWDAFCNAGKDAFSKAGGKVLQWNSKDLATMDELYKSIWEEWITTNEKRGAPAREAVNDIYSFIKGMGIDPPAIGYKPKK